MIRSEKKFNYLMDQPTLRIKVSDYPLVFFNCNSAGKILGASYAGKENQYWDDFCASVTDQELEVLLQKNNFDDLISSSSIWSPGYEVLRLAFAIFFGKDYLYHSYDPVICPCFGLRESERENLPSKSKMGCGLCMNTPQVEIKIKKRVQSKRYFKSMSNADWILFVDEKLKNFSKAQDWRLELIGVNGQTILIRFSGAFSQREEEEMQLELQNYLRGAVGEEFLFFLVST